MTLDWIDVTELSFNVILLLERVQLGWLQGWLQGRADEKALAIALHANPVVRWYMGNKNPAIKDWVDGLCEKYAPIDDAAAIREAEEKIMQQLIDLLTYAVTPELYANQEFLTYDDNELLEITDFAGKVVLDIGAGTGRLTFIAAKADAKAVIAVEPVENLRQYILDEAQKLGLTNVYVTDGIITRIPFYDNFADVVMGGHVFGDYMEEEFAECTRVVKPGGMVIFCPGSAKRECDQHDFLVAHGFAWQEFIEPPDFLVAKYWKTIEK